MKKLSIFAVVVLVACSREPLAHAQTALEHHEIRADQLPAPFATRSAVNPPRVASETPRLIVPPAFEISVFASGLDDPRHMLETPNGDVLLSEPGAGKITILRNNNKYTFISGLNDPYGLAIRDGFLYIGDEDGIVRVPYTTGATKAASAPQRITPLPSGGHSTRGIVFNHDGSKAYISVGSASNVSAGEPPERAAILEMNPDGSAKRVFASGLRNPVGMAWNPANGTLWTAVNERDGLGDNLVPDYITEVRAGAFYGWPYAYIGRHEDPRRKGERPDLVARATVPSLLIQSHSAPLGIAFYEGKMFPDAYRGSAFVALHGSWNRSPRTGYKVIRVPFRNGQPSGGYDDFVVGWMTDANARSVSGRPVDLLVLHDGSLLISDDGAEKIWRVTYRSAR
ncbi:MAG TPA: sorbosone dehydrogenase family protein [Thermoanaerobaculia bacterium]|nr:sorbosone dehydrogenase family protein [Thermoanaerobaculia bacterium]